MRNVLLPLMLAVAISGCAQGAFVSPAQSYGTPRGLVWPAHHFYGNDWMYVSQPSDGEMVAYKRKKNGDSLKPYETITGLSAPMGMMASPNGQLYVANSESSNILIYRTTRHGPQPKSALNDAGEIPVNVAATPKQQLVAVSNFASTASGAGSVSVYVNKQSTPARMLTYGSDPIQGAGIAIDSSGNCYWSFNDPKKLSGSIVEFAGCSGSGTIVQSVLLKAGGVAFDDNGNLFYVDELLGIFQCSGTSSCHLFLSIGGLLGLILPTNINFDHRSHQTLWVADAGGYIDGVSLGGIIQYLLEGLGGATNPPIGIAPAPGS